MLGGRRRRLSDEPDLMMRAAESPLKTSSSKSRKVDLTTQLVNAYSGSERIGFSLEQREADFPVQLGVIAVRDS